MIAVERRRGNGRGSRGSPVVPPDTRPTTPTDRRQGRLGAGTESGSTEASTPGSDSARSLANDASNPPRPRTKRRTRRRRGGDGTLASAGRHRRGAHAPHRRLPRVHLPRGRRPSLASGVPIRAVAVGLAVSYVVLPVAAFALAPTLPATEHRVGLFVVSAVPITAGSSIVWTRLSDGDAELAALVAVVSIVLSPIIAPPVLSALVGSTVALSPVSVVSSLLLIVGGGVALRVVSRTALSRRPNSISVRVPLSPSSCTRASPASTPDGRRRGCHAWR
ncbi:bile acid:sodium symporter [Haloplanus salilacus]|uniref:bile acid:sodium symporter n=1 Tax=Haloplanus salilacus TaxID=2949994 RepID=UPI0030CF8E25